VSATIHTLVQPMTVEQAWNKYVELAAMLSEDGSLLVNQAFHIEMIRAHARWAKLYLADNDQ
jgi:hypothetical protein